MSLSNPLNLLLIPAVIYLLYRRLCPSIPVAPSVLPNKYDESVYNWLPARHPDVICYKKFTASELAELDGRKSSRICLAIMRVERDGKIRADGERTVFDVTSGASFYGPGQSIQAALDHNLTDRRSIWQLCWSRCFERDGKAVIR